MRNKWTTIGLPALLAGILFIASCKKDHHYAMSNQDFVTQASSSNTFEIQAATLAQHNSSNADVKSFASQMTTDHTQTGAELDSLAARKGWTVLPEMLPQHRAKLDTLTPLTGTAFDKKYAAMMVASHVSAVNLFQTASGPDGLPDADLRAFAAHTLPKLQQHLQMAQQLQNEVGK